MSCLQIKKNTQKFKELEKQLQNVPPTAFGEPESSTKGKIDHIDLSFA